jgi:hypothetical protein
VLQRSHGWEIGHGCLPSSLRELRLYCDRPSRQSRSAKPAAAIWGMSHDQNLNAWFAEDGVTVRPTVADQDRERSWHLGMRLKAYGYGNDLVAAPPIVSQHVKDNRIEYQRAGDFKFRISNFEFQNDSLFQSAIGNRQSTIDNRQLRSGTRTVLRASSRASPSRLDPNVTSLGATNPCVCWCRLTEV